MRATEACGSRVGHPAPRPRVAPSVACAVVLVLALASGEASAAALRNSATALGTLALFAALLFFREWPVALTGSVWAAGTLFAAALWLLRTRYRTAWLGIGFGARPAARIRPVSAPTAARSAQLEAPPGADPEAVLRDARRCFLSLQAAWDEADVESLRMHTTTEMLDELLQQLPMRGDGPNRTDVVTLDTELLGLEAIGSRYVASVEFSGMIRESAESGAAPFKEVWMLTCDKDELPAWRLARHQALL